MPLVVAESAKAQDQFLRPMTYGPSGVGKSFSALTFSRKCPASLSHVIPKEVKAAGEPALLDDLLWIGWDDGATLGFAQQGVSVPLIDVAKTEPQDLLRTIDEIVALAKVEAPKRHAIVIDTVSELDSKIISYVENVERLDGHDKWASVASKHKRFFGPLMRLPCHVLFLCHSKAEMEVTGGSQSAQQQAAQQRRKLAATGGSLVGPAITGSSRDLYRRNVSFVWFVKQQMVAGGQRGAFFQSEGTADIEGKSRLRVPGGTAPADWRLVLPQIGRADILGGGQ